MMADSANHTEVLPSVRFTEKSSFRRSNGFPNLALCLNPRITTESSAVDDGVKNKAHLKRFYLCSAGILLQKHLAFPLS